MVRSKTFLSKNEKETFELGKKIAKECNGGEVFLLKGELGAGKTVFAKGVAIGLGVQKVVQSPTFVLRRDYKTKCNGVKKLIHIDLYRLKRGKASDLEFLEDIGEKNTVTLIEWPERVNLKKLLGKKQEIFIFIKGGNRRVIILTKT